MKMLVESPYLSFLISLDLGSNDTWNGGACTLANSAFVERLKYLALELNDLERWNILNESLQALRECKLLPRYRNLEIYLIPQCGMRWYSPPYGWIQRFSPIGDILGDCYSLSVVMVHAL